jgi:1-phosphofructokinase
MIHLVTLNPALDLELRLLEPTRGKIGEVLESNLEAGGKALNIARFFKKWRLSSQTWLGTGGGNHPTHHLYRSLLAEEGLAPHYLSSKVPIRLNVVVENDRRTEKYNHPGFELDLTDFGRLDQAVKKEDLLVLTGRLPKGMNPALYGSWIKAFKRRGLWTMVDSSGPALQEALKVKPWFFKVNLFEFSEAIHRKLSSLKQVYQSLPTLLKSGLLHGAVTNGAEGALVWNGAEAYWVKSSRKVSRQMVVGAGDGFLAGYLKGLKNRKSFMECARLACATGTAVAVTGIMGFDPRLVSRLVKSIKVKRF